MYSLNKLESYSRISALGPVGHRTSHFKRAVCISCRPCVDVHKGGGGSGPCGQGGQKRNFFVDVINGWPLCTLNRTNVGILIETLLLLLLVSALINNHTRLTNSQTTISQTTH